MSGKAGGLPRRPPLSTARAAFTASQRKQARRRLPDTSDIATASGVKTAPRSSLTTTTVPLSVSSPVMSIVIARVVPAYEPEEIRARLDVPGAALITSGLMAAVF